MKRTLLIVSIRVGDAVDRNNLEAKTAGSSDCDVPLADHSTKYFDCCPSPPDAIRNCFLL